MKKIIVLSFATLVLLTIAVSPIQAVQETSTIPPWFVSAIQPIKDLLTILTSKTTSLENRITLLENKTPYQSGADFSLPNQWSVSFYEDRFILTTPDNDPKDGSISLPNPTFSNNCTWNNAVIDSDASVRAIAHLSTGDIYGAGNCHGVTFKTSNIPPSGAVFEADIYVFWQGTEKHKKQTITIPDRPFPKYGLIISDNTGLFFGNLI